jgi:hypothetical protein
MGAQLARIEGLGEIVVGPDLEADHPVHDLVGRGHHDDRQVEALTDIAREREPVLTRQVHVQQHHVRDVLRQQLAHGLAAVRRHDFESVGVEVFGQHLADFSLVVDDQNALLVLHAFSRVLPDNARIIATRRYKPITKIPWREIILIRTGPRVRHMQRRSMGDESQDGYARRAG